MIKNFVKSFYQFSQLGQKKQQVRVRYAPSPTGFLHLGGLRTALYNYLLAKKLNGKFILRVEDTDKAREVKGSIQNIIQMLKWVGIEFDEGPHINQNNNYQPYYQSQRLQFYQKYANQLVENGDAYYCFCSSERLKLIREQQMKNKQPPKYDGHCRNLTQEQINQKLKNKFVIRLKVPKGQTKFNDIIHGDIIITHDNVDDQVLIKSDGYPTYHLANVVDDYLMQITHVIRGEEWLTSTPKHILIYKALGLNPPQFAHLPLIVNNNGGKLSKRQQSISIQSYIERDYLPEAIINFVGLLGWCPKHMEEQVVLSKNNKIEDEILSLQEMCEQFSLDRVRKRNAVLYEQKLEYFNGYYIRRKFEGVQLVENSLKLLEFKQLLIKYLPTLKYQIEQTDNNKLRQICDIIINRIKIYNDVTQFSYFWTTPNYNTDLAKKYIQEVKQEKQKNLQIIKDLKLIFASQALQKNYSLDLINKEISIYLFNSQSNQKLKNQDIFHLLRLIITGNKQGAPIGQVCHILGYQNVIQRIIAFENFI